MKKIVSIIAMLTVLSTSFAAAEKWQGVILPCSHNEKGELQFLLEQDVEGKFKGIKNEIKMEVEEDKIPSSLQKQKALENVNEILNGIGFTNDNIVNVAILTDRDFKTTTYLNLVNPSVTLTEANKYVWINASEAVDKTKNSSNDENLKNVLGSIGWTVGEDKNASFIQIAEYQAEKKYQTLTFYLDSAKKTVFLKIKAVTVKEKIISTLAPERDPFTTFAAFKNTLVTGALFSSNIFTIELYGGIFARVIFLNASTLTEEKKKKEWFEMEIKTFLDKGSVKEDQKIKINGTDYTIYKDIFNTLVTYLPKAIEAAKKLEEEKKTKGGEGGETGEKKGDAEAKEIVYKFAETLSKLTKA